MSAQKQTLEEKALELGLELENRVVVLTLKLPVQLWELLDKAEEKSGVPTSKYLNNLLNKALAKKLLEDM